MLLVFLKPAKSLALISVERFKQLYWTTLKITAFYLWFLTNQGDQKTKVKQFFKCLMIHPSSCFDLRDLLNQALTTL